MRVMAHIRAQKEVQIDQLQDQVRSQDQENMELREELRDLKFN
jgi:hypothetical protein